MRHAIANGIIAGFIATVVLSGFMIVKAAAGLLPEMNAIRTLANLGHQLLGNPVHPVVGWVLPFVIGTLLWAWVSRWSAIGSPGRMGCAAPSSPARHGC